MADAHSQIDPKLLEILVCPLTKSPLRYDRAANELISDQAGLAYPIRDGIPIMLVDEASDLAEPSGSGHAGANRFQTRAWPTELRLRDQGTRLEVTFEDGARFALAAEYLRVESPSAEVQGHSPEQKVLVPGKADVHIVAIEPVGHYAVRLRFDDCHDTGIFTWSYLYELGREQPVRWPAYLKKLAEARLSRA
jgi:DUF971 family protein/uncharacterized protein YbaR (Trm112 family)